MVTKILALVGFAATLGFSLGSNAIVLEPVLHAADQLGYEVVGDFEFRHNSSQPTSRQMRENLRELNLLCPVDRTRESHFVILAWSDFDYPGRNVESYSESQTRLAEQRAASVEQGLRRHVGNNVSFEHVNMASKSAQIVRTGSHPRSSQATTDVKILLKQSGAAPSGELEVGLFGEYSQRSKAVILVDCQSEIPRMRSISSYQPFQLAKQ